MTVSEEAAEFLFCLDIELRQYEANLLQIFDKFRTLVCEAKEFTFIKSSTERELFRLLALTKHTPFKEAEVNILTCLAQGEPNAVGIRPKRDADRIFSPTEIGKLDLIEDGVEKIREELTELPEHIKARNWNAAQTSVQAIIGYAERNIKLIDKLNARYIGGPK